MENFTLTDNKGVVHNYMLSYHTPKGGGLKVMKEVASLFLGANTEGLGAAIAGSDIEGLIDRLVIYCQRDGKPLREPAYFDDAFRGNYAELLELLVKVVELNHFLGVSGLSMKEALTPAV